MPPALRLLLLVTQAVVCVFADLATAMESRSFPDASNTGALGGDLTPSGPLVIDTPGTLIEGLDISGDVRINAPNVTLRNCRVRSRGFTVVLIKKGVAGVKIEHCEIDNFGVGGQGIAGQGTFIANNIHGCTDGIDVRGDNTIIRDNYIHDMSGTPKSHFDTIQADGAFAHLVIDHNTLVNENGQTSVVMLDNYWGPINDVSINDNLMIGGGYTIYIGEIAKGQSGGGPVTNVSFTNNSLIKGFYGYWNIRTELGNAPVVFGNRDAKTERMISGQTPPNSQ